MLKKAQKPEEWEKEGKCDKLEARKKGKAVKKPCVWRDENVSDGRRANPPVRHNIGRHIQS